MSRYIKPKPLPKRTYFRGEGQAYLTASLSLDR